MLDYKDAGDDAEVDRLKLLAFHIYNKRHKVSDYVNWCETTCRRNDCELWFVLLIDEELKVFSLAVFCLFQNVTKMLGVEKNMLDI